MLFWIRLRSRSPRHFWPEFYCRYSQSFSTMPRPPTPSSKAPTEESEWRFRPIDAATEWIEDYRPGGLHPIHLGDTLGAERYKILRKLGYGSFSTVWLARDAQESRYVAIKVSVARASETNNELGIFEHLARHRDQRGARSVMELLHSFDHEGPNGRHLCLVFPVMGPSATTMERKFRTNPMRSGRYPLWIAKSMLKQLLLGLSFLHRNGVTHTDIQPGNLLFSLPNIDSLPESDLKTDITQPETISDPVQRVDGEVDLWSPRYTAIPQPLTPLATVESGFTVRISDMGGASLIAPASGTTPITPVALRAPELILTKSWDMTIDIWSFGCLFFEFLTGTPLFVIGTWGLTDEEIDDDHLCQLISALGPLPTDLCAQWPRYSSFYSEDGTEIVPPEVDTPPLETFLKNKAPPEMDTEEVKAVGVLLRGILHYNPAQRPTAADLLKDPWFEAIG
ncbi:hypothetical protein BS47DRAFT_197256 [Hydnum rufescens UP504]|uniref:non-specific serine/threonine protein kinase n=1 Tax=Hydnum rufescens UP504 TaxID=1448309 RepID=A0A9P6DYT0_9AGAM|nr:hypothetical protein BS47DRAFT_197256 [Hydnum rufescens UP504]